MRRKSKIRDNTRIVVVTMSILFFLTMTGFYLFNWYINIDIGASNRGTETILQKEQLKQ